MEPVDSRHIKRERLLQDLFACTFMGLTIERLEHEDNRETILGLLEEIPSLDAEIQAVASERPLSEINKVDLAILRLIMFESRHKKTPKKVLLDEAIELAKSFGSDTSPKFINGSLAQILLGH